MCTRGQKMVDLVKKNKAENPLNGIFQNTRNLGKMFFFLWCNIL